MNAPIRVLGIGSPWGDDEMGIKVANALEDAFDPGKVTVSAADRPGARLVDLMRGAQFVVLIDAVKRGAAPGTLHRLEGKAILAAVGRYTSTHGFGLAEALQLAERLGTIPKRIVLWGVEMGSSAVGEGISAAVRDALPNLVRAVAEEVNGALEVLRQECPAG